MLLDDWSYVINVSSGRTSNEVKCVMGQKTRHQRLKLQHHLHE